MWTASIQATRSSHGWETLYSHHPTHLPPSPTTKNRVRDDHCRHFTFTHKCRKIRRQQTDRSNMLARAHTHIRTHVDTHTDLCVAGVVAVTVPFAALAAVKTADALSFLIGGATITGPRTLTPSRPFTPVITHCLLGYLQHRLQC